METCPFPVKFPAGSFLSPPDLYIQRVPKPPLCSYRAATNSKYSAEEAKLGTPNRRMFILGMGYVGQFFAHDLKNKGWDVSGTCTSIAKRDKLEEIGFNAHVFNTDEPELGGYVPNHGYKFGIHVPNREKLFKRWTMMCAVNADREVWIGPSGSTKEYTLVRAGILPRSPAQATWAEGLIHVGGTEIALSAICQVMMLQHGELLKRKLNNENVRWLGYLSSTSVYGDCGGLWVDESYQPSPSNELAKTRLAAEEGWLSLGHDLGLAAQVFRLGGIYGPGRSAIDTITKQEILSEVQKKRSLKKYTSRVHVADICNALNASIHKPFPGRIYNIVDDEPAPRSEVFSFAHNLIQEKWPGLLKQATSPCTAESLITESSSNRGEKRVSNARMKKELGVKLQHPNYRSGLQSIINLMQ